MSALIIPTHTPFGSMTNQITSKLINLDGDIARLQGAIATAAAGYTGIPGTEYEAPGPMQNMMTTNNFGVQPDPDAANAGQNGADYAYAVGIIQEQWLLFYAAIKGPLEQLDNGSQEGGLAEGEGAGGGVQKVIDRAAKLVATVSALTDSDVLVGVPRARNARTDGPIGNAMLARIHEYGSPAHNIPARPFLHPGVKAIRPEAIAMMRDGAKEALKTLDGEGVDVDRILTKVGLLARNSVVEHITDPNPPFAPLQPATIRARLRRTQAGRRKIKQIKAQGKTLTAWASEVSGDGTMNIRPLLDTLQLRAAITYVIRRRGL